MELSGQVVTVHRGWTNRKKLEDVHSKKSKRQNQVRIRSVRVFSSLSNAAILPTVFGPELQKRQNQSVGSRHYEFVHGTHPFRNRDPDVRKLVRAHAMRDTVRRKKQEQGPKSEPEDTSSSDVAFLKEAQRITTSTNQVENVDSNAFEWNIDSFPSMLSVELDRDWTEVVHAYATVSRRMYPRESVFKFNPVSPTYWLNIALADEVLLHAVKYIVSSYSGLFEGVVQSRKTTTEFSQCVGMVNKRLAGPQISITDGMFAAVICLAMAEVVHGNEAGWKIHMNGLKRMLELKGGFSKLPETLQIKLIRTDIAGAVDFIAKTHFSFKRLQRHSTSSALLFPGPDISNDRLTALLTSYSLNERLTEVFKKLTRFSQTIHLAVTDTLFPTDPLAFATDTFEIQTELLSIPEPDMYESTEAHLQEALRIGALVFMKETLQEYPLALLGSKNLVQTMKNAISFILHIKKYFPLLLWLLIVGGISSRQNEDRMWFTARLAELLCRNSTWEDVRRILHKVVWIEKLHDEPCISLWEEVEAIRMINSRLKVD